MHLKTDTGANSHFARVPTISRSRNAFSLAEKHVTSMQFDKLYPVWHKFIYPGDTLSFTWKSLARLQTQIAVLYDDLYFDAHAWFVPMRLIQTDWARFQFNAQPTGPSQDNSSLTTPKIDLAALGAGGFAAKSLYDYFGYPTQIDTSASTEHINNYLARAYNLVWNSDYRDENLQNAVTVDLDNGPDAAADYVLLKRGRRHDKFSSMLTAAQKGTAPYIPLGTSAPVLGIGTGNNNFGSTGVTVYESDLTTSVYGRAKLVDPSTADRLVYIESNTPGNVSGYPNIRADLTAAIGATANQVRQSFAVQQLLEADARGGTRDVEAIQHRFGVTVPDFRMNRPEFIGSTTWSFDGHIVPQTSETGTTPQGTLTQFSQTMNAFNINHSFVEHGVFFILVSARSNVTYQQGLQRELSHRTRYDFYQPEFANLGEVAVLSKEMYFNDDSNDNDTQGFQEYAYWRRYGENRVSAEFRSNFATSLDSQHMADDYSSRPTLGSAWIQSNTPIGRNIAVDPNTADPIHMNMMVQGKIAMVLPMYSIPGLTRM